MDASVLFKKLRLNTVSTWLIVNAPAEFLALLDGVSFDSQPQVGKVYDYVQVFATGQSELEQLCEAVKNACKYDCLFWVCYPKGTGKIKSDIKRETAWVALKMAGVQAVSQIAIDETWSALRGRPPQMVGK